MMGRIICCLLMGVLMGCSGTPKELSGYYFPLEELSSGKVYVYKSKGNGSFKKDYFYYHSSIDSAGRPHLHVIGLNRKGLPIQFLDYRMDLAEVRLVSMHLVETNRAGKKAIIPVKIEQPYVFNLAMEDTSKQLYAKLVWNNPFDSLEYSLEKVRTFKGFGQMEVLGEKRPALYYDIATEFKSFTPKDGETDSAWPEQEVYGAGLGLAGYRMVPDPDEPLEMELIQVYDKEVYERLFHIHLDSLKPTLAGIRRR